MTNEEVTTVHVVRTAENEVEVFATASEAWRFARCKRGASVLERPVRTSMTEAQVVYERRVHILGGKVQQDTATEEPYFTSQSEWWAGVADIESFEAKDERWTILGFGTNRVRVDELVSDEIRRLTP